MLTNHTRTPAGPRTHRPHLILIAGLIAVLAIASLIGGW